GIEIYSVDDLERIIEIENVEVAIMTVPMEAGQETADRLIEAGIKGILNFTPIRLNTTPDVTVHSIDLGVELQALFFQMKIKYEGYKMIDILLPNTLMAVTPVSLIVIAVVALIIFGPKKLPHFGRAVGSTLKEFKDATKGLAEDDEDDDKTNKTDDTVAKKEEPKKIESEV